MAELMTLIEQSRKADNKNLSSERFANNLGMTSATYSRHKAGKQPLSLESIQAYADYAKRKNRIDILAAIGAFVLRIDLEEISINPSKN